MQERNVVIWGAGKIGRGFIGELFYTAGYYLTFVDADKKLVDLLEEKKSYRIFNMPTGEDCEERVIDGYQALHIDDNRVAKALITADIIAISVFPKAFKDTVKKIAASIRIRSREETERPLDILLCLNAHHPAPMFRELFLSYINSENQLTFFHSQVGVIETLVIRMAVEPDAVIKEKDPLAVLTNGYRTLIIDAAARRTGVQLPDRIMSTERIRAEETRKMYTYNMAHAVFAYAGWIKRYTLIIESVEDPDITVLVRGALDEMSRALQRMYGFSRQEMDQWNNEVLKNIANPILKDTIHRVGADPIRKLGRSERLVGAGLLCRGAGIYPGYIETAIACCFSYGNLSDESARRIQSFITSHGIRKTVEQYAGIVSEGEVACRVIHQYQLIQRDGLNWIAEDVLRHKYIAKAYELGFSNEKRIRGCAQCTIKALLELTGREDPGLFQAASGLSGGIGITGDGSCGGYIGGVLFLGSLVGRRIDHLNEGDKQAQYASYAMAQKLHDRFIEAYGSVNCSGIHNMLFGKSFCLRDKQTRDEFEDAGAHFDKCTSVIGTASAWTAEILLEEGLATI